MRPCQSAALFETWYPKALRAPRLLWLITLLVWLVAAKPSGAAEGHAYATDIAVLPAGEATQVVVTFTAAPSFTARLEKERNRLVVDVANAALKIGRAHV
jgi:hypothetical protein